MKQETICDCCGKEYDPKLPVIVNYQIGAMIAYYYYCSQSCKENHKMQLIREAGL